MARVRLTKKPVVVLDWGWMRARKNDHFASQYHYLIPEHVISEAMGTSNPQGFMEKFRRISLANAERLFIGKHAAHVFRMEGSPGVLIDRCEIAYSRVADFDLGVDAFDPRRWKRMVEEAAPTQDKFLAPKLVFDDYRADFARMFRKNAEERFPGELERTQWVALFEFLRQPNAIDGFVAHEFPDNATPEWKMALNVFPDQHAIGRMARLSLWSLLRPTKVSAPERLRNDWEDLRYAFLASYADEFWTGDKALAEVVERLFPTVKVKLESGG